MKEPWLYKVARPILKLIIKMYCPILINTSYIPSEGPTILAGNHKNNLDPLLVGLSTKRCVHFLAKDELMKGWKKPLFARAGIIPVNRRIKDKDSLEIAVKYLNNDKLIGIFPEGTFNQTNDIIMPFKYGTVKMASVTKALVVPFAIVGNYKFAKKSVKIIFDKPYKLQSDDLEKENNILMDKVRKLIVNNKE